MRAEKKKNHVAVDDVKGKKWIVYILYNHTQVICWFHSDWYSNMKPCPPPALFHPSTCLSKQSYLLSRPFLQILRERFLLSLSLHSWARNYIEFRVLLVSWLLDILSLLYISRCLVKPRWFGLTKEKVSLIWQEACFIGYFKSNAVSVSLFSKAHYARHWLWTYTE